MTNGGETAERTHVCWVGEERRVLCCSQEYNFGIIFDRKIPTHRACRRKGLFGI